MPSEIGLSVRPSLPHLPGSGWFSTYKYQDSISNSCGDHLNAPAGNDAGYSCPDAGLYNYRGNFTLFGDPDEWYSSFYGFDLGVTVKVQDVSNEVEYAHCYVELKVKKGHHDSAAAAEAAFFGGGSLALVVAAGMMYRKRRVASRELRRPLYIREEVNFEMASHPIVDV